MRTSYVTNWCMAWNQLTTDETRSLPITRSDGLLSYECPEAEDTMLILTDVNCIFRWGGVPTGAGHHADFNHGLWAPPVSGSIFGLSWQWQGEAERRVSRPWRSAGVLDATDTHCAEAAAEESHQVSVSSVGMNGFSALPKGIHPVSKKLTSFMYFGYL